MEVSKVKRPRKIIQYLRENYGDGWAWDQDEQGWGNGKGMALVKAGDLYELYSHGELVKTIDFIPPTRISEYEYRPAPKVNSTLKPGWPVCLNDKCRLNGDCSRYQRRHEAGIKQPKETFKPYTVDHNLTCDWFESYTIYQRRRNDNWGRE